MRPSTIFSTSWTTAVGRCSFLYTHLSTSTCDVCAFCDSAVVFIQFVVYWHQSLLYLCDGTLMIHLSPPPTPHRTSTPADFSRAPKSKWCPPQVATGTGNAPTAKY